MHTLRTEAIARGWVCPDGRDHYWTQVLVGDRTVDERCDRCDTLKSERDTHG